MLPRQFLKRQAQGGPIDARAAIRGRILPHLAAIEAHPDDAAYRENFMRHIEEAFQATPDAFPAVKQRLDQLFNTARDFGDMANKATLEPSLASVRSLLEQSLEALQATGQGRKRKGGRAERPRPPPTDEENLDYWTGIRQAAANNISLAQDRADALDYEVEQLGQTLAEYYQMRQEVGEDVFDSSNQYDRFLTVQQEYINKSAEYQQAEKALQYHQAWFEKAEDALAHIPITYAS